MDSDVRGSEGVELPMDNRSGVVVAVASTLIPLAALVVALRFYARHHLDRWVGIDDWAVLISLVRSRRCASLQTPPGHGTDISLRFSPWPRAPPSVSWPRQDLDNTCGT